jgi:hypothetical protein
MIGAQRQIFETYPGSEDLLHEALDAVNQKASKD